MAKKRVYVSSTFVDLEAHRAALKLALERAGYDVECMEKYPAFDERPLDKCLADVAACDIYVLILAHRYGHRPSKDNPERQSITQLEYEQATRARKKRLCFVIDPKQPWSPEWIDKGADAEKLSAFRAAVEDAHGRRAFTTPDNLASQVLQALPRDHSVTPVVAEAPSRSPFVAARDLVRSGALERALVTLWHTFTSVTQAEFEVQNAVDRHELDKNIAHVAKLLGDRDFDAVAALSDQQSLALAGGLDRCLAAESSGMPSHGPEQLADALGNAYWFMHDGGRRARRSTFATQGSIERVIFHHRIIPAACFDHRIRVIGGQDPFDGFAISDGKSPLRIFLGSFADGVSPMIEAGRAVGLSDEAARRASLRAAYSAAVECGAHVVVFPELTLPETLVAEVSERLLESAGTIRLMLAGSFHVPEVDRIVNRAPLLRHDGHVLLRHRELVPATTGRVIERITPGREVTLLATSAGLLGVLICRDFCDQNRVTALRQALKVDWLLVPSLDDSLSPHIEQAKRFARDGTHSAVANQLLDGGAAEVGQQSFGWLAGPPAAEATYVDRPEGRIIEIYQEPEAARRGHLEVVK